MSRSSIAFFAILLASCGPTTNPIAGIYDTTITPKSDTPNPQGVTCPAPGSPTTQVFDITHAGGNWSLDLCNEDCSQSVTLATSSDGYTFKPQGCSGPWCEDITVDLVYTTKDNKTTISGTSTIVLTMPGYASGSCTEVDSVEGTKR